MMRVSAIALLAFAGAAASAQTAPIARPFNIPEADAVRAIHRAAACVVADQTGDARRVLALDFRTERYGAELQRLMNENRQCVPRSGIMSSGLLFAGGMAEQLFLRDHGNEDPVRLLAEHPADPQARNATERLSFCVVRRAPAPARAVLASAPTSPEERTAMEALRPAIAECLVDAREARMNRPGLRSLVALAFYNLTRSGRLAGDERP